MYCRTVFCSLVADTGEVPSVLLLFLLHQWYLRDDNFSHEKKCQKDIAGIWGHLPGWEESWEWILSPKPRNENGRIGIPHDKMGRGVRMGLYPSFV
jgi:hypothetical protein